MASLRDALRLALAGAGQSGPAEQELKPSQRLASPAPPRRPDYRGQRGAVPLSQERRGQATQRGIGANGTQREALPPHLSLSKVVAAAPVRPAPPPPPPDCQLRLGKNPRYKMQTTDGTPKHLLPDVEKLGVASQCLVGIARDQRELVMGLDFGTSSVKVVIGDAALGKSFLVPFNDEVGLGAFLLPSRLFQSDDKFSLVGGSQSHRDLKLSFIANPTDVDSQARLVAFLALVISRARGWLFSAQRTAFKNTEIIWRASIGLPAPSSLSNEIAQHLKRLLALAWHCAGHPHLLTQSGIAKLLAESGTAHVDETLEIDVVPEIAAQIYGFVVSTSFDRKAANIYLMVDVGAGTVDSSLFHVKPAKGGKWDFEFFTTAVEPHGVMNLHRYRNAWWQDILKANGASTALVDEVQNGWRDTDHLAPLPESFQDYFQDVGATFRSGVKSPDQEFFENRVVTQVRGKTLWRAWRDKFLNQQAIADLPLFLCGGGARMDYYLELENQLKQQHGFSWLKAEAWTMGVPGDLVADGLAAADYDRVSVAYGLSRLDVGKVIRAVPIPKVEIEPLKSWTDNYIDKDQC